MEKKKTTGRMDELKKESGEKTYGGRWREGGVIWSFIFYKFTKTS